MNKQKENILIKHIQKQNKRIETLEKENKRIIKTLENDKKHELKNYLRENCEY